MEQIGRKLAGRIAFPPMILIRAAGLPLSEWNLLPGGMPDWQGQWRTEVEAADQLLEVLDKNLQQLPASPVRTRVYNLRKDFFQRRKLPAAGKLLDLMPLPGLESAVQVWETACAKRQEALEQFDVALEQGYRALQLVAQNEVLKSSLLFSSHDLLAALPGFYAHPAPHADKKQRRVARALLQYFGRAVFKTSPLSGFTSVGVLQENKEVPELDVLREKRLVTPNVAILPYIYEVLLQEPAFYSSLTLRLNPCIVAAEEKVYTWLYYDGEREAFQQAAVDPLLQALVGYLLENGRKAPYPALLEFLQQETDAGASAIHQYLQGLSDSGLLEWNWPDAGRTPRWCGNLYQYLGRLPATAVLSEAAYLLNWLRTAARSLPFQHLEAAKNTQYEAVAEVSAFLERHGVAPPPVPAERIFFEDVYADPPAGAGVEDISSLIAELAECQRNIRLKPLSALRQRLFAFAGRRLAPGASEDFMSFSRAFLNTATEVEPGVEVCSVTGRQWGALAQVYQDKDGYKVVVNALFPGGGKLWARWMALLPENAAEAFEAWGGPAFPWHTCANVNFLHRQVKGAVAVPGGLMDGVPLGAVKVCRGMDGALFLTHGDDDNVLLFNDVGLESVADKPPVMQVLWHLGTPEIHIDMLLPEDAAWTTRAGYQYRERVEKGRIVLARESWILSEELVAQLFAGGTRLAEKIAGAVLRLKEMGIPERFFARLQAPRERPQCFDMQQPLSMVLLKDLVATGSCALYITEMLPEVEERATEQVWEWEVYRLKE